MSIASSSSQSSSSQNPNLSILPDLNSLDLVQLLAIVRSIVSKITVEKRDLLLDLSTEYTGEIHIQAVLDEQELKVLCGVVGEIEKRCCRERDSHNEIEGPSMESSLISSVKNDLVSLLRLCHGHSELYHQILRILASVSLPDSKSIRRPLSRPRSPVRAADYTYAQYTPEERFLSPPETDPAFTGYYYTPREKSILSAFSSSSAISKGNGMSSPTSSRSSNHSMNPNNSNNNNYHYHNQNLYLERPRTPSSPADFTPPSSYNPSFEPSSSPSHPSAHTQSHPNSISLGMVPPRPFSAPNSAPMPPPASVPLLDVCDDGEYPFGDPPIQTTPHAHQIQNRNTATPPTTYTQHTSVTGSHPASPYRSSSTSVYPPPVQTSTSSGPHPAAPAIPSLSQSPSLSFPSSSRNPIRRAQASEESILSEMHGRSPAFSVKESPSLATSPVCWICTGSDDDESDEDDTVPLLRSSRSAKRFISPCRCKGGMKYVHHDCLLRWIETKLEDDPSPVKCPACTYLYRMEYRMTPIVITVEVVFRFLGFLLALLGIAGWVLCIIAITDSPNSEYILHYVTILALVGWWLISTLIASIHKLMLSLQHANILEPDRSELFQDAQIDSSCSQDEFHAWQNRPSGENDDPRLENEGNYDEGHLNHHRNNLDQAQNSHNPYLHYLQHDFENSQQHPENLQSYRPDQSNTLVNGTSNSVRTTSRGHSMIPNVPNISDGGQGYGHGCGHGQVDESGSRSSSLFIHDTDFEIEPQDNVDFIV